MPPSPTWHASQADEILRNDSELNCEYAPIAGIASFTSKAAEPILSAGSLALQEKRAVTLQTISGTGAVHLGAPFSLDLMRAICEGST
ncbi:Aspartate aminotransferase, cytoplasmic [Fusarium piperis]|uniref:Aspartate aminotransferase, cytoplasmic n=1 Tax=Fusarium piperis TaxID=1435070 RepID=A0A9W8WA43_9HYPO|nr:Aspartate aminotransferase, cytoplasmic [Fusarium piperis]